MWDNIVELAGQKIRVNGKQRISESSCFHPGAWTSVHMGTRKHENKLPLSKKVR